MANDDQGKANDAESVDTPDPAEGAQATEGQTGEEAEAQLQPLDVYAVLRVSIGQLAGVAWQKMGLQADPFTNQVHKDIAQARVAIDAAGALADKLLPHLQGQEARDYQALLTDLRLNFVRQAGEAEKTG